MAETLSFEIDVEPEVVREVLLQFIQHLQNEQQIPLRTITVAMLDVVSEIVKSSEYQLNESFAENTGIDEEEEDEVAISNDSDHAAWQKDWAIRGEFEKTEICKRVEKLTDDIYRYQELKAPDKALKAAEELFSHAKEHAQTWLNLGGKVDDYSENFTHRIEWMLRCYVILNEPEKMATIAKNAEEINSTTGEQICDMDFILRDLGRFSADVENFQNILAFLEHNHDFPQKKIFSELSLDGRAASYMLTYAEDFGIINRRRNKDTWLLSLNS